MPCLPLCPQVITFIDMGGHEKYLKTALYGLTSMLPDYLLLCVCAQRGISKVRGGGFLKGWGCSGPTWHGVCTYQH
jgi:hypothetical protein